MLFLVNPGVAILKPLPKRFPGVFQHVIFQSCEVDPLVETSVVIDGLYRGPYGDEETV
jgi:hypothetical protein